MSNLFYSSDVFLCLSILLLIVYLSLILNSFGDTLELSVDEHTQSITSTPTTGPVYEPGFIVLPKGSKMYFGRIPDSIDIQPQPKKRFFKGSLTNLFVDNYPVGLWNATVCFFHLFSLLWNKIALATMISSVICWQ